MANDPIQGFGERIIKRARLPITALLSVPFLLIIVQYFLFLLEQGFTITAAVEESKKIWGLVLGAAAIPVIALAFFRELELHTDLDKILGVRRKVGRRIATLMAELASETGYEFPERIKSDPGSALEWFYTYANQPSALRTYAFEIWEGYYVGLYLSLATAIAFLGCVVLVWFLPIYTVSPFLIFLGIMFIAFWAVRHWKTIPKIMKLPVQQVKEIRATDEVLAEARRRFD